MRDGLATRHLCLGAFLIDMVVTDMAVIAFPGGKATLMETAPGLKVAEVLAVTEAELVVPDNVPEMKL